MKIGVFTRYYWPDGGGAELATYLILKYLSREHSVEVYTGTQRVRRRSCCRIYYWELLSENYKPLIWVRLLGKLGFLRKILKKFDIVYIPSNALLPLAIIVKTFYPDKKVIVHLHDYQPLIYVSAIFAGDKPDLRNELLLEYYTSLSSLRTIFVGFGHYINFINALSLYYADKIICVSKRQAEIVIKHLPSVKNKLYVAYNPLPEKLKYVEKKLLQNPSFIYMGSGKYGKGFYMFLDASIKLLHERKNITYYLTGTLGKKQLQFIERLNRINPRTYRVLGWIKYDEIINIHRKAWALLFPSIWEEPLPYAVIESGILGTIPIAARVGGVEEILKDTVAEKYMFMPGNIEEFVDRIKSILDLSIDEIIDNGARLSKVLSKRFSKERLVEKITNIFKE